MIMFYLKYPALPENGERQGDDKPNLGKSVRSIGKVGLPIWIVSAIWMMYNASTISYLTFGGDYYKSIGIDAGYAGFLTSMLMIGALILSPVVGLLTDKMGNEEYFIAGGSVILTIALFLVPRVALNPLLLGVVIGISGALIPSPVFSLVPGFLPPEQMGLGYGILSTCLNVGVLFGPLMVGILHDRTSNYLSGFDLMAAFALSIAVFVAILVYTKKIQNKGAKKDSL